MQATAFPVMKELVADLAQHRPLAIGTGSTRANAEIVLTSSGLAPYFRVITSADDVVHHKPNPDTFLLSAAKIDTKQPLTVYDFVRDNDSTWWMGDPDRSFLYRKKGGGAIELVRVTGIDGKPLPLEVEEMYLDKQGHLCLVTHQGCR